MGTDSQTEDTYWENNFNNSQMCVEDVTGLLGDWNAWFSDDEWTSGGDLLDLLTNQKIFNVEALYVMSTAHGTLYTHQQTVTRQYIVMEDKQRPCLTFDNELWPWPRSWGEGKYATLY